MSCLPVRLSVRMEGPSGRILMKLCIWYYFRKFVDKMQMSLKSDKNNGKITRRRFDIYDCLSELLLVWEMFQIKMFWRKNTQSIFHTPPLPRKLYRYEIMSKNVLEPERPQMIVWWCAACCISKATRVEAHTRAHTRVHHPRERGSTRTHAQTHTEICNTWFSKATTVSWTHVITFVGVTAFVWDYCEPRNECTFCPHKVFCLFD